jgi:L-ascorbate metabolism protein UlaG (beta-lactamase superfamily)
MDIEYKGANCIVLTTKKIKVVIDPKISMHGLRDVSVKDAVELATEARFLTGTGESMVSIEGPGEYEVADFSIKGIPAQRYLDGPDAGRQTTIYRIESQDVRIAVLGNIASELDESQLESIGVVDIVIIPIGGNGYTLSASNATKLLTNFDAKVVIPVHYYDSNINYEVPQDKLDEFTKDNKGECISTDKFRIKSATSLPQVATIVNLIRK